MKRFVSATAVVGAVLFAVAGYLLANPEDAPMEGDLVWALGGGLALLLAAGAALLARRPLGTLLESQAPAPARVADHPYVTLFLISFVGLFVEVALIRYIGSQFRVFSFYKNIPLVAAFLGLGLGCWLRAGAGRDVLRFLLWLFPFAVVLSVGTLVASRFLGDQMAAGTSEHVLGDAAGAPESRWEVLGGQASMAAFAVATMTVVTLLFVPLGRLLGAAFDHVPRLRGYSVNLLGSLAGTAAFVLLSTLWTPPWVWLLVGLLPLLWWLAAGGQRKLAVGLVALSVLAVAPSFGETVWSPYQKLVGRWQQTPAGPAYLVEISDVFYQVAMDLRPEANAAFGRNRFPHYDAQFQELPQGGRVLIVGAGTGNDVAAALRAGAGHVDAVDIDPAIVAMGQRNHPERPYDDPRVQVVIDDARSAFRAFRPQSYDVVVFGLLDSHTQLGVSSVRLDNYVFTRESFESARGLLRPGGRFVVTAAVFRPWFLDRIATLLAVTCGAEVQVSSFKAFTLFSCVPAAQPQARFAALARTATLPTDDWPFLYLEAPGVPLAYLVALVLLALAAFVIVRAKGLRLGRLGPQGWHLFLLGGAFLLVEVHAINRLALLFGSTWLVSAITISLVLVLILLANLTAALWRRVPYGLAYAGLGASLLAGYWGHADAVLGAGVLAKLAFALLLVLPAYFAGVIFARSFSVSSAAGTALGANMLGAVLGGWIEYSSMAIGVRALCLVALALYLGSLLMLLRAHRVRLAPVLPVPLPSPAPLVP